MTEDIEEKVKVKTAYDNAEALQRNFIYTAMLDLLALQTTLDGKIKAPPPITPQQCLILAEKCLNAWLRLVYKTEGKAVLTVPQKIGTDKEEKVSDTTTDDNKL